MQSISVTLTLEELLRLPGEAVTALILAAQAPVEFIRAAYDAESAGKGRWVVLNQLRTLLTKA